MKKIFALVLMCLCSVAYGQQDSQYSLYMFNGLLVNPAYAGSKELISTTALYRHQWAGFDGAPKTMSISAHGLVNDKYGVGVYLENDNIGVRNRTNLFASYAYQFHLNNGILSAGIQAGLMSYSADFASLDTEEFDDVFSTNLNSMQPNFGLGLYYFTPTYYAGISVPHLLKSKFDNEISTQSFRNRTYLATGGLVIPISSSIVLRPSVMLKSIPSVAPLSTDITLAALFRDQVWAGVSYRVKDSLDFMLSYEFISGLRLGYSYDFPVSDINKVSSGSHELMMGYDFMPKSEKVITPRYF